MKTKNAFPWILYYIISCTTSPPDVNRSGLMIQHTSESRQISCYLNLKVPKWQVDICVYCILNRTLFSPSFVKEHLYSDLCSDVQEFCTQVKQVGCYWLTKRKKVQLHNMEFYVIVLGLFYIVKTLTKQAATCSIKNWYRTNFTIAHAWKIVTCISYLAEDLEGIWLHAVWSLQACIAEILTWLLTNGKVQHNM